MSENTSRDERVERVAAAMADSDAEAGFNWIWEEGSGEKFCSWGDLRDDASYEGGGYGEHLNGKDYYRRLAKVAIAAYDAEFERMLDDQQVKGEQG